MNEQDEMDNRRKREEGIGTEIHCGDVFVPKAADIVLQGGAGLWAESAKTIPTSKTLVKKSPGGPFGAGQYSDYDYTSTKGGPAKQGTL